MKPLLYVLLLSWLAQSAAAQTSITLGIDGNGFTHTGGRLRLAQDVATFQLAAYIAGGTGGMLRFGDQTWGARNAIVGAGLNKTIIQDTGKGLNVYIGASVEGVVQNYTGRETTQKYTDMAVLIGPQVGLNAYLSPRLSLNAEWGVRAGINYGHVFKLVMQGTRVVRTFYRRENTMLAYVPTTIGLSYKLGKRNKKPVTPALSFRPIPSSVYYASL